MRALIISSLAAISMGLPAQMTPGRAPAVYDVTTERTLEGRVEALNPVPGRRNRGVHLTLRAGQEAVEVRLGPSTFLEAQGLKVAVGDTLKVTGSMIGTGAKAYLLAREVQAGGKSYRLRDAQGVPAWRGGRKP